MFAEICSDPTDTSPTLRLISFVVAVCSSTAAAMAVWGALIWSMTGPISAMAATAAAESVWMAPTRVRMSSVARAVSPASSLTSPATTAKPLPASPPRAASVVRCGGRGGLLEDGAGFAGDAPRAARPLGGVGGAAGDVDDRAADLVGAGRDGGD